MDILWDNFERDFREFEKFQKDYFAQRFGSDEFANVVSYSLIDIGGKRIRPLLLIKTARHSGCSDMQTAYKLGVALECIHTYSLIHDDLPCMDNDKYRRGFLSAHSRFGEALAVLSGDALLNFAYETILDNDLSNPSVYNAAKIISEFAGSKGMIKGQVLDMNLTKEQYSDPKQKLIDIYLNKTAALFRAAVCAGAALGRVDDKELNSLDNFAKYFGLYFQLLDDLSDYESEPDKFTFPAVFGLENSIKELQEYKKHALDSLKGWEDKYPYLAQLISKVRL
ncbi:MAG TPA: polyprenyl synthetase family protein [Clostridia bacterium]